MALSKVDLANQVENQLPQSLVADNVNFRNLIINGDMSIAQRGTSFTGLTDGYNGTYTLDRFAFGESSTPNSQCTISQDSDVPTGQGFAKSLKVDVTTAETTLSNAELIYIWHRIEGQNLQYLKFGTSNAESLTLSFWVKSNLTTGKYGVSVYNQDNSRISNLTYNINSSNTWEKKTFTISGDTVSGFDNDNASSLMLSFIFASGSDYTSGEDSAWHTYSTSNFAGGHTANLVDSTSNDWYVTGVQLEAGTAASDFEFLPYDINLMRCERYYKKVLIMDGFSGQVIARTSSAAGATEFQVPISGQPMRTNPTASLISAGTPDIRVTKTLGSGTGAAFDGGNLTLNTSVSSDMTGKVIRVRGGASLPDGSSDGAAIAIYNNGNTANAECDAEL
jgi:hypothetical protein